MTDVLISTCYANKDKVIMAQARLFIMLDTPKIIWAR